MVGAMWGDVAPWYMKSVSDTEFAQQYTLPQQEAVKVKFDVGADGKATALTFKTVFDDRGKLNRVGDLPEGW